MDLGKFKYAQQKRESESRKKQKTIEVKEVKFRPNTDTHDYNVKLRNVERFLGNGDKVKVTMRFRGREMAHQQIGQSLLERVAEDISLIGKIEELPKLDGRQMYMMIAPAKYGLPKLPVPKGIASPGESDSGISGRKLGRARTCPLDGRRAELPGSFDLRRTGVVIST